MMAVAIAGGSLFITKCSENVANENGTIKPTKFLGCKLGETTREKVAEKLYKRGFDVQHIDSLNTEILTENIMFNGILYDMIAFGFVQDTLCSFMFVKENETPERQDDIMKLVKEKNGGDLFESYDGELYYIYDNGRYICNLAREEHNDVVLTFADYNMIGEQALNKPREEERQNYQKKTAFVSLPQSVKLTTDEPIVYICPTGSSYAYHRTPRCGALTRCSRTPRELTLSKAEEMGRTPCGRCY